MALRSLMASEERRDLGVSAAGIEIRAAADAAPVFAGHAAVFNSRTAIGNPLTWGFYEQIADGAFTKTLSEGDARMLVDHDSSMVVSRTSAGTLRLSQDKTGLAVDSDLDTGLSYVSDLTANLRNGNITGMSFGFYVVKDQWDTEEVETNDGNTSEVEVRTLLEVKLPEVSAVTFPAYEETDAGLRALAYRHDRDAIAKRVQFMPAMSKLLADIDREPGESTRGDQAPEPAASTRLSVASLDRRKKALLARFPDLTRI
jgi:HK97 family phage prohead protease